MNESLFSRLFHYSKTDNRTPQEDYLTELLAWMIDNLAQFGQDYVSFLCSHSSPKIQQNEKCSVNAETQVVVSKGRIDMVITVDSSMCFVCEHKVDSSLHKDQITEYKNCREEIKERYHVENVYYVFLSRIADKLEKEQKPDITIRWHEIYNYLNGKKFDNNSFEPLMVKQFLEYLTEVGMGMKNRIQIGSVENYCEVMKLDQTLKGMFCEIKNDIKWDTKCSGLADFVASYHPEIPVKRWGRIGIEFSNEWKPNIFAGVVLDNADHKLKEFNNQPQFVVLIDCDPEVKSEVLNKAKFKSLFANIPNCENDFSIDKSPKNKWRLLILQKPLKDVLKHSEYEEQKKDITDEIIAGIDMILKYYNSNK